MATFRKGQLSVETMIIYGVIILVTLSVIGGLIYFKVLDISSYLPDKCDLGGTSDLKCEEIGLSSTTGVLSLGIRNTGQKPIQLVTTSITDDSGTHFTGTKTGNGVDPASNSTISSSTLLAPGNIARVEISTGSGTTRGKVLKGSIYTQYQFRDGAITLESSGDLRIRAS